MVVSTLTITLLLASTTNAYEELIDRQGGIRVSVLPLSLSRGHQVRIRVWIDTRSKSLDKNALKTSILVDDQGKEYRPISLRESQPSAIRYTGDLLFPDIGDDVKTVKLLIEGVPGVKVCVFEWALEW
jgi:hypothetical protein